MRAIVYGRVSTEDQVENGTSLESQLAAGTRKATDMGAMVVSVYTDQGVSGVLYHTRPGIQAAIEDIEAGRADILIVYSISRLSREVEHQQAIKKRIARARGQLIICDMPVEATEEGDLMFGVAGSFAQYERQLIRKRTMNGRRSRASNGSQPCRSMHPYGYRIVTKADVLAGRQLPDAPGRYVVIPEEAQWVLGMFERYAGGASLREVCRWLNDAGVATPRNGHHWRPSTLKRILDNPAYKGSPVFGRHMRQSDEKWTEDGFRQVATNRLAPMDRWVYMSCEPIVSESTWGTCQDRLQDGKAMFGGNPERRHLLTGLLRCPICDKSVTGTRRERRGKTEHYYQCPASRASRNPGKMVCNGTVYDAPTAEHTVFHAMVELATHPQMLAAALAAWRQREKREVDPMEVKRLRVELAGLQARERAAIEAQIVGIQAGAPASMYALILTEAAKKRESVEKQLAETEEQERYVSAVEPESDATIYAAAVDKMVKVLTAPELTVAEKHAALAGFIKYVRPEADAYRVELRPLVRGGAGETVAIVNTLWPPAAATSSDRLT